MSCLRSQHIGSQACSKGSERDWCEENSMATDRRMIFSVCPLLAGTLQASCCHWSQKSALERTLLEALDCHCKVHCRVYCGHLFCIHQSSCALSLFTNLGVFNYQRFTKVDIILCNDFDIILVKFEHLVSRFWRIDSAMFQETLAHVSSKARTVPSRPLGFET